MDETSVWLQAADDLGIRVTAPFEVLEGKEVVRFDALVHDFGSEKGMLLFSEWSQSKAYLARRHGYGYSCIASEVYVRDELIEVLRDWGWAGQTSDCPSWCVPLPEDDVDAE